MFISLFGLYLLCGLHVACRYNAYPYYPDFTKPGFTRIGRLPDITFGFVWIGHEGYLRADVETTRKEVRAYNCTRPSGCNIISILVHLQGWIYLLISFVEVVEAYTVTKIGHRTSGTYHASRPHASFLDDFSTPHAQVSSRWSLHPCRWSLNLPR